MSKMTLPSFRKTHQDVLAAPLWVKTGYYLTPKGIRLSILAGNDKEKLKEIHKKYGKNRYGLNPDAFDSRGRLRIVKRIIHQ